MHKAQFKLLALIVTAFGCANVARAGVTYTQDPNLTDFTNGVSNYATFIGGNLNQYCSPCIPDLGTPEPTLSPTTSYTPTTAILTAADYPRVIGTNLTSNTPDNPIVVQFSNAVSNILVFDNIDHTSNNWDYFQYDIYGGVLDTTTNTIDFTLLYDPTGVAGTGTGPYTLSSWTGTAPTLVNNILTPGLSGFSGTTGYEAYFNFGTAYQYYGFRPSSFSIDNAGEQEAELSAVAQGSPVPEPSTLVLAWFATVIMMMLCCGRCSKCLSLPHQKPSRFLTPEFHKDL